MQIDFQEKLVAAIAAWDSGDVEDEWMFQKIRDDCVGRMDPESAFREIGFAFQKLLLCENEMTATELVEVLLALAARSQTNQVPDQFLQTKSVLASRFEGFEQYAQDKLQELFLWYRL